MIRTVCALALLALSGPALAYQQDSTPAEEVVETESDEVQVDAREAYRFAAKALTKCRQKARREGGAAAAVSSCAGHRKRMLAAQESMREKK
jgi:hypothetical protein